MPQPEPAAAPKLWVVAGPNGAGKSSIIGEMLRQSGADYLNPDEVAQRLRERNPSLSVAAANEAAWQRNRRLLEQRIAEKKSYAFETTLGGRTIAALLHKAADAGFEVWMWFVALESPERHLERIRARVAAGGHDIPEELVRERYQKSRHNLVLLLPRLRALRLYDNSIDVGPAARAKPKLLLDWREGRIVYRAALRSTPEWAKPIVAAALASER